MLSFFSQMTSTLKSALGGRVIVGQAQRLASERQNLGHGEMCPASASELNSDVYGRLVSQQTLNFNDADCSHYAQAAIFRMGVENNERPYLPICAAGIRGGDLMAVGRNMQPQNLYGPSTGGFSRTYPTANNLPPDRAAVYSMASGAPSIAPFNFSMNSVQEQYRG